MYDQENANLTKSGPTIISSAYSLGNLAKPLQYHCHALREISKQLSN